MKQKYFIKQKFKKHNFKEFKIYLEQFKHQIIKKKTYNFFVVKKEKIIIFK